MRATAAYLCLYLGFIAVSVTLLGVLLYVFAGGGSDPVFGRVFQA